MGAFPFWAQCRGIRTRKGAELRKREAFSSAAREERSDEAGRGRRQPHADIPHRPPLNWKRSSQGDRFCLRPVQRDSNPQGCGAEETRSVFQRSTQGAERRSGARPPAGGRGIPPSHINNGLSVSQPALGDVPKVPALKERHQVPAHPPSKDRRPKPERTKSALNLENISPVPKSEPSSTKWRAAPAGRALSLSRVPHAKKAT